MAALQLRVATAPTSLSSPLQFCKQSRRGDGSSSRSSAVCLRSKFSSPSSSSLLRWSCSLFASQELFAGNFGEELEKNVRWMRGWSPLVVEAAWTRRSKGQPSKNKKSWKQRTEKYFKPFMLDVFISSKYINAKVMHRVTSSVVSVATTSSKDLRNSLHSLNDLNACKVIGKLIAERSLEADVYAVAFDLRKNEKLEGKLAAVIDSAIEHGLTLL